MKVYVFRFTDYESDDGYAIIVVKELREDLARDIAMNHIEEMNHDPEDIDLGLVEEFDYRDREILYTSVQVL